MVSLAVLALAVQPATSGHTQEKRIVNALGMEFVLSPAGSFVMGSPVAQAHRDFSENQHRVIISRLFYLQTTEVTVDQWRAVMSRLENTGFRLVRELSDR